MKTSLLYGFAIAIGGALLTFGLYFTGFYEAEKFEAAQWISMAVGIAIAIAGIVMGIKARRAEIPPGEEFGYGRALGTGVMIALFAALFGLVTSGVYFGVIDPGFGDRAASAQIAKMEAQGMSGEALEAMEKGMKFMMSPAMLTVSGFFSGFVGGVVIALIVAAFLKRAPIDAVPPQMPRA